MQKSYFGIFLTYFDIFLKIKPYKIWPKFGQKKRKLKRGDRDWETAIM